MTGAWAADRLRGSGNGIGLSTTRERLDRLFGQSYRLELSPAGDPGAVVSLDLPYISEKVSPA